MKKSLKKIAMVILLTAALAVPAVFLMGATQPVCDGGGGAWCPTQCSLGALASPDGKCTNLGVACKDCSCY